MKLGDPNLGLLLIKVRHMAQSACGYEGLDPKLWNCASQATYWHSDGLR